MLTTLAIANYRSLRDFLIPLGQLNVITGPNGSGKSSVYRAQGLLAETAQRSSARPAWLVWATWKSRGDIGRRGEESLCRVPRCRVGGAPPDELTKCLSA